MFKNTKQPKSITKYNIFSHVTDFGQTAQFDLFEGGYSFIKVLKIPTFIEKLKSKDTVYENIINNYVHILENEFKGLDGLENMTADNLEITDGIKNVNFINKVNTQGASTITLNGYSERSGSVITKFNRLFLSGIKDPHTQIKTYHGLIETGELRPLYENEVFTILYVVTDNTMMNVEESFVLYNGQPTNAELNIYNTTRGEYDKKELSLEFQCIPYTNDYVNQKAQEMVQSLAIIRNSNNFIPSNLGFKNESSSR